MIGIGVPCPCERQLGQYRVNDGKSEADPGGGRRLWTKLPADRTIPVRIAKNCRMSANSVIRSVFVVLGVGKIAHFVIVLCW